MFKNEEVGNTVEEIIQNEEDFIKFRFCKEMYKEENEQENICLKDRNIFEGEVVAVRGKGKI